MPDLAQDPRCRGRPDEGTRVLRESLQANFDLRAAAARVEVARARAGIAKSFLFPEVNLSGGVSDRQVSRLTEPPEDGGQADRDYRNYDLGFTLSWEIDIFGRVRREKEAATAVFLSSEEARRGVVITLVSDVARSCFLLRTLDLELDQAIANRSRTAAVIPDLERQIALQENLIHFLPGQPPGPIPRGATLTEHHVPPVVPAGLPSALLDRRPDVREAAETDGDGEPTPSDDPAS